MWTLINAEFSVISLASEDWFLLSVILCGGFWNCIWSCISQSDHSTKLLVLQELKPNAFQLRFQSCICSWVTPSSWYAIFRSLVSWCFLISEKFVPRLWYRSNCVEYVFKLLELLNIWVFWTSVYVICSPENWKIHSLLRFRKPDTWICGSCTNPFPMDFVCMLAMDPLS